MLDKDKVNRRNNDRSPKEIKIDLIKIVVIVTIAVTIILLMPEIINYIF